MSNQENSSRPLNPDDRPLPPPADANVNRSTTSARRIINPDEKLLVPPSPEELKSYQQQNPAHKQLRVIGKSFGQKVAAEAHEIGDTARRAEKKVEKKVGEVIQEIKHIRFDWVHIGVLAAIAGLAIASFNSK